MARRRRIGELGGGLGGQQRQMAALRSATAGKRPVKGAAGPQAPAPAPPAFVNTARGNPRAGQRFDVVTKKGVRYHRYANGLLIADKVRNAGTSTPAEAKAKGVAEVPTPGAPAPRSPSAAPPKRPALQVNQVKGNPRFGQSYRTVTRGGRTYHRYKGGDLIAMGATHKPAGPVTDTGPRTTGRLEPPRGPRGRRGLGPAPDVYGPRTGGLGRRGLAPDIFGARRPGRRWGGPLRLPKRRKAMAR